MYISISKCAISKEYLYDMGRLVVVVVAGGGRGEGDNADRVLHSPAPRQNLVVRPQFLD